MAGKCQPVSIAYTDKGSRLAQDATHIYWVGGYNTCDVLKVPKAGGATVTLASGPKQDCSGEASLSIGATHVYVTQEAANRVIKVPLDGGSITEIATTPKPRAMTANATHVYWSSPESAWPNSSVSRVPLDGGATELFFSGAGWGDIWALTHDDTYIYLSGDIPAEGKRQITRVPLAGGASEVVVSLAPNRPDAIAVDGANVYWWAWMPEPTHYWNAGRISKSGGQPEILTTLGLRAVRVFQIFVDHSFLYAPTQDDVWMIPLDGSAPTAFKAPVLPWAVIADAKRVYWSANGSIMKVVR